MTESLSFPEAIELFQLWGFTVEAGPRPAEVSLILEGPDYRTSVVYEAGLLPAVAAAALQVRWRGVLGPVADEAPVRSLEDG